MNKFKIGDKVKLNSYYNTNKYGIEWNEFWYENKTTIFIIHSVTSNNYQFITSNNYQLKYTNDEIVMNPMNDNFVGIFRDDELELYTNPLPDDLFEL